LSTSAPNEGLNARVAYILQAPIKVGLIVRTFDLNANHSRQVAL
jgi:hypothetical protein